MNEGGAPAWLADFQAQFGAMLRTPLDGSADTLRAAHRAYDRALCGAALDGPGARADERLAVYNRQYWFRLFGLMHNAFPLTTRLLGHWSFNEYAARFLREHPPRGWNIDRASDGFETFFAQAVPEASVRLDRSHTTVERDALLEAVRIDAAWKEVFLAPSVDPFRPSARVAERLLQARLVPSPTVVVFREHWPLLELRRRLVADDEKDEASVPVPPRHPAPRWWALVRKPAGIGQLPLESREAELFGLLREYPVGEALARLEVGCAETERAELPAKAQGWLARSVELDFWIGMDDDRDTRGQK